jgi:alpha-1,3/alpha-1,6-mannosyltransferase
VSQTVVGAGAATIIAVNSRFTAGVFKEAFRRIGPRFDPAVIYPAINLDSFVPPKPAGKQDGIGGWMASGPRASAWCPSLRWLPLDAHTWVGLRYAAGPVVSINRFERKKNIGLALEAFAIVRKALEKERSPVLARLKLVVAGERMWLLLSCLCLTQTCIYNAGGYDTSVNENVEYLEVRPPTHISRCLGGCAGCGLCDGILLRL